MVVPTISSWARKKGINLVATGDWTHPVWLRELKANLIEDGEGVYKLKKHASSAYKVKGQNATKHSPLIISEEEKYDIAASFQHTAFTDLVQKALDAANDGPNRHCTSLRPGSAHWSSKPLHFDGGH